MKHQTTKSPTPSDVAILSKPTRMADKGKRESKVEQTGVARDISREEMIRQSAYSLYEARNFAGGHELDDWFQAEAQVDELLGGNAGTTPTFI